MTTMTIIGIVASCVFGFVIVAVVVSKFVFHVMKGPLEDRIIACYGRDEVLMKDLKANSFGVESAGVLQLRGNGGLVLTAKCLHFFMFLPKSEVCIPLDAITEITITKSHLGKATIYDLLKVRYSTEGQTDSIAWYLSDPWMWKIKIEELTGGR